MRLGKILCKIGLHRWSKPRKVSHGFASNVYDMKQRCERCNKTKRWIKEK